MEKIKQTVGVAFIEDGKLLIVRSERSSLTNSWTLVGGGVETNETPVEAALREISEEIGEGFEFEEQDLMPLLCFKETANSDPDITIEMHLFYTTKKINITLNPNDEILNYHWFKLGETEYNLSSSILDHFLPFAIQKGLIF